MGLFDGQSSHGRSRGNSPTRSTYSSRSHSRGAYTSRPSNARSNSSFFGATSSSRSPWFGSSKSSYYGRRPRDGYVQYLMQKLQRMIRDLWYYARKHPMKAFFAVVVPLLSAGGAVHGLLKQFGVRLPFGLGAGSRVSRGGYYDSRGYGGGSGGIGGDWGGTFGSVMQVAKAFM